MSLVRYKPATRYLISFSYIGTRYWGVQRQVAARSVRRDNTIQSAIETAINSSLKPTPTNCPVSSVVSSRTDSSVHASENFMICDLYHPTVGMTYNNDYVSDSVNRWLCENNHLILVKDTVQVPRGYHIRRQALEREYIIRVLYHPKFHSDFDHKVLYDIASVHDLNRVSVIETTRESRKLDLSKVEDSIRMMIGTHDFRSFEANPNNLKAERKSTKTISKFFVKQTAIACNSQIMKIDPDLVFLDFVVRSKSFLYKQVRRMVGLSLSVGVGLATLDDVKYLLENPRRTNWKHDQYITAAPNGLYLRRIGFAGANQS